jgi:hypothetical protein
MATLFVLSRGLSFCTICQQSSSLQKNLPVNFDVRSHWNVCHALGGNQNVLSAMLGSCSINHEFHANVSIDIVHEHVTVQVSISKQSYSNHTIHPDIGLAIPLPPTMPKVDRLWKKTFRLLKGFCFAGLCRFFWLDLAQPNIISM